jgi:hypothetical protein
VIDGNRVHVAKTSMNLKLSDPGAGVALKYAFKPKLGGISS